MKSSSYRVNIAYEAREHGVSTFSLHPGIVPTGLTTTALTDDAPATPWHARRRDWLLRQLVEGRGTPVERTVQAVAALVAGTADHLSGRYLTVDDVLGAPEPEHGADRANRKPLPYPG